MKKLFGLALALSLIGCATVQNTWNNVKTGVKGAYNDVAQEIKDNSKATSGGNSGSANTTHAQFDPNVRADPDAAHWDIARLDTAANADYLNAVEKDVILEMNKVRTNPKLYADLYVKPVLNYNWGGPFGANSYLAPGASVYTSTQEGKSAVNDCINAMSTWVSMGVLRPEKGLWKAAKEHALDQSKTGATGHNGSNGSTPETRIKEYGTFNGTWTLGENCSYGPFTGRDIVVQYLIDDGVPSRGHRANILNAAFTQAGDSVQTHPQFRYCGTIDFAAGYTSK
jgi:uncharacterized protein YkwD